MNKVNGLVEFIENSKSSYHAVSEIAKLLKNNGFELLNDACEWKIEKEHKYYVTKGGSSILAFTVGNDVSDLSFNIVASHTDSPTFKIKPNADFADAKYMKLNTEPYGGLIMSTWMDRPLSVAGRVLVKAEKGIESRLVDFNRDFCMIPNVCIHMNREVNTGFKYNPQVDMLPMLGLKKEGQTFNSLLANELACKEEDILGHDLFLYNRDKGSVWGLDNDFVSIGRLDDLECAYTSIEALIAANNTKNVNVCCCFDNEEVGSGTKQGADSTFLFDTLSRVVASLGLDNEAYLRALSQSFIVSADNAHAVHPNHPEKSDSTNRCHMNEGIVIKHNAAQSYTTDGYSNAIFTEICNRVNVPLQHFTNRSDLRGGGTLGSISSSHISIMSVDIGLPQLAMHSAYETAGVKDVDYMITGLTAFYETHLHKTSDEMMELN